MVKKLVFLAVLGLMFQASAMMNQRVVARNMHKHRQKLSRDYKVEQQVALFGELREAHRSSFVSGCSAGKWSAAFGLACCTMLVAAAAVPTLQGEFCSSFHEDGAVSLRQSIATKPNVSIANSTFYDDGERCYLKKWPDEKSTTPIYWTTFLRKLKRAAKLLVDYENEH